MSDIHWGFHEAEILEYTRINAFSVRNEWKEVKSPRLGCSPEVVPQVEIPSLSEHPDPDKIMKE